MPMLDWSRELLQAGESLANTLRAKNCKVVFAESCTAGLIAATLSRMPGVSGFLCGSAVVYQEETKTAWLQIPPTLFGDGAPGVVSQETAEAMALGVLSHTPHADWSASITGHLGPNAPAALDGIAWVALARRKSDQDLRIVSVHQLAMVSTSSDPLTIRLERQQDAATRVLLRVRDALLGEA